MKRRLLLFDIDGTLMDTGGAGGSALLDAAETVLQVSREYLPPLDLAGATDGAVVRKLFADAGVTFDEEKAELFRLAYLERLEGRLHDPTCKGRLLSGVPELLQQLRGNDRFYMGLLTGNIRRGAMIKLQRFDIQHHFLDGGFGDDGIHRNELGPVAVQRMEAVTGYQFAPEDVIVIGDTPKDIACADAIGARCLAVATGMFNHAALCAFSPWHVAENLDESEKILHLLAA